MGNIFKIKKYKILTFCLIIFWMVSSAQVLCPPIKGTIKIIPTPTSIPCTANVIATPVSQNISIGESTNIVLTSSVPGTTFKWSVTQTGVTGASDGNGNTIAQILTNTGTATYTVTPMLGDCSGTPVNVVVNVLSPSGPFFFSEPQSNSSDMACKEIYFPIEVYANREILDVGTRLFSLSGAPLRDLISAEIDVWFQCGAQRISYSVDAKGYITQLFACETIPCTANVTATPVSQNISTGESTNIVLTSSVPGTTFKWSVTQTGVTGASDGNGNTIAQILTNTGTATYTVTPMLGNCSGTPVNVVVNVLTRSGPFDFSATPQSYYDMACKESYFPISVYANREILDVGTRLFSVSGAPLRDLISGGPVWFQCGSQKISYRVDAKGYIDQLFPCQTIPCTANVIATPAAQSIISGESTNIVLTSDVPGTAFKWSVKQTGVTGASDGNGNTIVQTLTNTGTATYTITPMLRFCSGTPVDVNVNVSNH